MNDKAQLSAMEPSKEAREASESLDAFAERARADTVLRTGDWMSHSDVARSARRQAFEEAVGALQGVFFEEYSGEHESVYRAGWLGCRGVAIGVLRALAQEERAT